MQLTILNQLLNLLCPYWQSLFYFEIEGISRTFSLSGIVSDNYNGFSFQFNLLIIHRGKTKKKDRVQSSINAYGPN
jgi:hypothetical protein